MNFYKYISAINVTHYGEHTIVLLSLKDVTLHSIKENCILSENVIFHE